MRLEYTNPESLLPAVEALIFATDEPLSAQEIRALILDEPVAKISPDAAPDIFSDAAPASGGELANGSEPPKKKKANLLELSVIKEAIQMLNDAYEETGRTFRIIEIAGGYQFATKPDVAAYVSRLYKDRSRRRLSGAALESLSIIAYKQPVSKSDIENIRGVNCDEVIKSLLEKNLITITGRAESVGRPLLYGTTQDFLRHFGLGSMRDLPKPREIEELLKEESVRATTLEEAANEFVDQNGQEDSVTVDEVIASIKEEQSEQRYQDRTEEEADAITLDVETGGTDFSPSGVSDQVPAADRQPEDFAEDLPKAEAHPEAAAVLQQADFGEEIPNDLRQEADQERKLLSPDLSHLQWGGLSSPPTGRGGLRVRPTGVKTRPPSRSHPSRDSGRPSRPRPEKSGERPALRKRPGTSRTEPHAFESFKSMKEIAPKIKPSLKNKVVTAAKPVKDTVRLNRFIASAGIAARRKADELITRGKVTVNGKVVKELGVQVNPSKDQVTVDGKTISMKTRFVYLLLNKPKDAISTVKDETDRNTVMNYVNTQERVYPVGRLDRNTTGVLFLTNDGDLTARLTHPKYSIEREYHVTLDKPLNKEDAQKIATGGVDLGEGDISSAVHVAFAHNDPKDVFISIREGKYHEVRRLFEAFHYDVRKLDRTMFAGITHRGMKRGESRVLTPREVRSLKGLVGLDVGEKFEF